MEQKKVIRRQRRKRTVQEIINLLGEYRQSDMNVITFCKKHDIVKGTFYNWMNKYQSTSEQVEKPVGFVPLAITGSSVDNSHNQSLLFAEVSIAGGISIRIFEQVSARYLKELTS